MDLLNSRRNPFNAGVYSRKGGYAQFRRDYHNGSLTESDESQYLALLRKLRQTIALMPIKHLEQSVFKDRYGMVGGASCREFKIVPSDRVAARVCRPTKERLRWGNPTP